VVDSSPSTPRPSHEEIYDRAIDSVLRGERVDLAALRAEQPDFPPELLAKLEKMQRVARGGDAPPQAPLEALGPYTLLEPLGEGGMGMVHLAEHQYLRRRVALKLLRPELRHSSTTRARFEREALAVARLKHPHIVAVHDAGEDRGIAYLAMELVEGRGLDEELARLAGDGLRMDQRRAARIAAEMASALHAAHAAGVLHRDVKPGNIRLDREDRALLLDFGLAQADGSAAISASGMFRGTPAYAAPEQIDDAELDARSDVYALGATLYECLAGRPPFEGATTLQLFQRIVSAPPAPIREHAPGVDADLERIVLRALAKRRDERQPDASALESELRAWLARPEEAGAAPAATTAAARGARSDAKRRWSPRHAALVVVLAGGAWFASSRGTRHEPDPAAPVEPGASRNPTATAAPSDARPARADEAAARVVELLGAADLPFGRRLDGWERTLGPGTFGDDEDSSGVVGLCRAGLALKPLALSSGSRSVRGVLEPLGLALESTDAESPPRATGVALEWQDGRILAAGIVVEDGSARLAWCALARNDAGAWSRSRDAVLLEERGALDPWSFHLRFDADGVQLEWPGAAGGERVERAPSRFVGLGRPSRFHTWVEQGAVRCTRFVLEGS
jgi:tRNA A-37 threonylcarbamoyl transferase component Bud32